MQPGDLRRFKDGLLGSARTQSVAGRPFMVLETATVAAAATTWTTNRVSFLIDGRIERGWGGDWVESNSEDLNETR